MTITKMRAKKRVIPITLTTVEPTVKQVPLTTTVPKSTTTTVPKPKLTKKPRPDLLVGTTAKIATGCGNMYVTMNRDDGEMLEVFATLGKAGSCAKAFLEALTRCVTLGIKYGIPLSEFVAEMKFVRCPSPVYDKGGQILSCPDAVATAIQLFNPDLQTEKEA